MVRALNKGILQQKIGPLKGLIQMLRSGGNPQMMLQAMATQNPKLQKALQYVNENGGDPQKAFYKLADEMGVNPTEILSLLQ